MTTNVRFLTPAQDHALKTVLQTHTTLERAVRHWLGQNPPVDVHDVIAQDEFTHDVVVLLPDHRAVVYDAT